jgi:hypothetical protein
MNNPDYLMHKHPFTLVEKEVIELFTSNDEFNMVGVELFKEILSPLITIVSVERLNSDGNIVPFNHEEAALIGNLVRYNKLCSAFLEQFTRKRTETSLIFLRCITETFVNLKFFLKYKDQSTLNHYIKQSLRQEKQFIELVRKNISDKSQADDIEIRMQDSIKRSFRASDFEEDEINNSSKWDEKVKSRINEILGPEAYILLYGSSSHAVHGNWQDLINFHLTASGDGFLPNIEWSTPTLQILSAVTLLSCDLLRDYAAEVLPDSESKNVLLEFVDDLMQRTILVDVTHETFIQNKRKAFIKAD